jgi:hypothetical protein
MDSLDKRTKPQNRDMIFGTWNVRSLYSVGSLVSVSKELSKYKLDLVGVQDGRTVTWNQQEKSHISMERGMRTMN